MYKYIKNPINNKKVNIHSKLGKSIIKQYLNLLIGGTAPPPPPQPRFPAKRNDDLPHRKTDLYDLDPGQDIYKNKLKKYTIDKKDDDYNCKGNDYDEERNCLEDADGVCIKKNDVLQFPHKQCTSKERACNNYINQTFVHFNKNPFNRGTVSDNFWREHCPSPPPPASLPPAPLPSGPPPPHDIYFDNLDDGTIRRAIQYIQRYTNNTAPPIETWDVSRVTDMSFLFEDIDDLYNFNGNITQWNTSNVTNMECMFGCAGSFNQPLQWNTNNVTNMHGMFRDADSFNQPLRWNTENVRDMRQMFVSARNFNQPLNFDTGNVTNMRGMFESAHNFNQPLEWNTNNVTNMGGMFRNARNFNGNITDWDTGNVRDMSGMFQRAESFNQPLRWNTENVRDMSGMFLYANRFDQSLEWNTENVTNMEYMFANSSGRLRQ